MSAAAETVAVGGYYTDGKRLGEVLFVEDDGKVILEDCRADLDVIGDETSLITCTPPAFARDWKLVRAS